MNSNLLTHDAIKLIPIQATDEHILSLYELLKHRIHGISHQNLPSLTEHSQFVKNHPYREWLLIQYHQQYVGTVYLQQDNSIGLNLLPNHYSITATILPLIVNNYAPLPAIKSVRNKDFIINLATHDHALAYELEKLGAIEVQRTFMLKANAQF